MKKIILNKIIIFVMIMTCHSFLAKSTTYTFEGGPYDPNAYVDIGANWTNPEAWDTYPGTTIAAGDIVIIDSYLKIDANITVYGTVNTSGQDLAEPTAWDMTDHDVTIDQGGVLNVESNHVSVYGGTHIDATWIVNGTININGAGLLEFERHNHANHTLTLGSTGIINNNGKFHNLDLDAGNTFTNGGTLTGTGVFLQGAVVTNTTSAKYTPGNSIGTMPITGNMTFENSTYQCEVDGVSNTTDLLTVSGQATLTNAKLDVTWLQDPQDGDVFTIMTFGSKAGSYAASDITISPISGLDFTVTYTGNSVVLNVILGCGLASNLPTATGTYVGNSAGVAGDGFTYYCDGNGNLLLGIKTPSGWTIPADAVELQIGATSANYYSKLCGGTFADGCIVLNDDGTGIINRYWEIDESKITTGTAGFIEVKHFFTNTEYNALNAVLSANGQAPLSTVSEMQMYNTSPFFVPARFPDFSDIKPFYGANILKNGVAPTSLAWVLGSHGTGDHSATFQIYSSVFKAGGGLGGKIK